MAEEEGQKAKGKDLGKLMSLAFMALNLVVLGGGAYLVFASTLGYEAHSASEAELNSELVEFRKSIQQQPVMYTMDPFNTNLDGLPRRLIRVEINLEMLNEEGFEEVISLGAESRDSIVRILNGKKFEELETVQGKLHLKNQIIAQLNGFLERGVVKNVYFSDFAIQ